MYGRTDGLGLALGLKEIVELLAGLEEARFWERVKLKLKGVGRGKQKTRKREKRLLAHENSC